MIRKLGDPHFYFLTKKIGLLPNSIKTLASKFFPCLYQIHLNTGQSFGWQPLLASPRKKKRCHEIIQNQTRSAELIRYKPSIFSCCSNTRLYSPCYVTPSYILLYHPTLFFLICLSNEEIFLKTLNHPVYREILFIDT